MAKLNVRGLWWCSSFTGLLSSRQSIGPWSHDRTWQYFCRSCHASVISSDSKNRAHFSPPCPDLNYDYLCDPRFTDEIRANIRCRKGVGDIDKVRVLYSDWKNSGCLNEEMKVALVDEAKKIPNQTHPQVMGYGDDPVVVEMSGAKRSFNFKPKQFHQLAESLDALRTKDLGIVTGARSYYLKGALAQMERALIKYTVNYLLKKNFLLVSVPDLLHPAIIEGCGMNVISERTQVYALNSKHYGDICLSGTAEMALAGLYVNSELKDLKSPIRLAAVSRCFRAETSGVQEEKGIYRVHQFTKVEMFGLTASETGLESDNLLKEFVTLQKQLFSSLGLHYQLLDMPPHELGAPAYRKFDIEAWMPGRRMYGEISSSSNCTDYQSRRLNIRYKASDGNHKYVHTVNGTACAIPRMLIALLETHQQKDGTIDVPSVLRPHLNGCDKLKPVDKVTLHPLKSIPVNVS